MLVSVFSVLKRFDKPLSLEKRCFGADKLYDVAAFVKNYKTTRYVTPHGPEDIQRCERISTFQRLWETGT